MRTYLKALGVTVAVVSVYGAASLLGWYGADGNLKVAVPCGIYVFIALVVSAKFFVIDETRSTK